MSPKALHYTILVTANPYSSPLPRHALYFCQTLERTNHHINCIFFYHDAVLIANALAIEPNEVNHIVTQWQQFASQSANALILCANNSIKRGIVDKNYANETGMSTHNIAAGFELKSLTNFITALQNCDRFIQFGP